MGDLDNAFSSAVGAISLAHHVGTPLHETDQKMRNVCMQCIQYNQNEVLRSLLPFWQIVMNLSGRSDNPSALEGEAIDILNGLARQADQNSMSRRLECSARLMLAYYLEDWTVVREMLPLVDGKYSPPKAHYSFYQSYFVCTMCYLELFRRTNDRKLKAKVKQRIKEMQKWVNGGGVNIEPGLEIVKAEFRSLECQQAEMLDALFQKAAECAGAMGFLQQQAIAHERAAHVFIQLGRLDMARDHVLCANELYSSWGCHAKVEMLECNFADMLREGQAKTPL